MLRRRGTIRWAAALTLAVALARPVQAAEEGLSRFWADARSWIAAVWPWTMADTTSDRGPYIDPNGTTSESDHGSHMDPNGATSESERGGIIDPNG